MFNQWSLNYSSVSSRANALLKSFICRLFCYRKLSNMGCWGWKGGRFRRDHLFRNSPDSFRLLYHEGCGGRKRAETKVSPDQNCCVLFWFYITVCVIAGQYERKMSFVLSFGFKVWVLLWAKHFSLPPPLSALLQRRRWGLNQESLDFLFGGGVILVYLSGVNFQALSSFWACSSLSLVCSSSAFILRKNKLMAGSTMDDLSWAALGCWTCFRYWIWVCKVRETIRMHLSK